ncbi:MAG: hypothetical protein OXP71_00625 [Candidatus Poribacteria bacterium]|nr:hypothetical protein [Candidatus Poribacteria bacterium]
MWGTIRIHLPPRWGYGYGRGKMPRLRGATGAVIWATTRVAPTEYVSDVGVAAITVGYSIAYAIRSVSPI